MSAAVGKLTLCNRCMTYSLTGVVSRVQERACKYASALQNMHDILQCITKLSAYKVKYNIDLLAAHLAVQHFTVPYMTTKQVLFTSQLCIVPVHLLCAKLDSLTALNLN